MGTVNAGASKDVFAPPDRVLVFLRDYRANRPKILTGNYSDYRVERGGEGTGTVVSYRFDAGRRQREFRLRVEESENALRELDERSSFVSTWRVEAHGGGSTVSLEASWQGARGIRGFFERTFAPLGLRRIYGQVLDNLADAFQG